MRVIVPQAVSSAPRTRRPLHPMPESPTDLTTRRAFWTAYQPGFRASDQSHSSAEFYAEVERVRYSLERGTAEIADFDRWGGRDVLEAGCGIGIDGIRFTRAGARYTGMDFSPTAIELARRNFEQQGLAGRFVLGSITDMPFADRSFDLVYSTGVIHHLPETRRVVDEIHRVLRPGGRAVVMIYHRDSFNFLFSIMVLRRALAALLLLPGMDVVTARVTGEPLEVLRGHKQLLREHGLRYLTDGGLFLSNNTDGPGNPLSKVYTRRTGAALFSSFAHVETHVRFLN